MSFFKAPGLYINGNAALEKFKIEVVVSNSNLIIYSFIHTKDTVFIGHLP
jgi:hypothetical protein